MSVYDSSLRHHWVKRARTLLSYINYCCTPRSIKRLIIYNTRLLVPRATIHDTTIGDDYTWRLSRPLVVEGEPSLRQQVSPLPLRPQVALHGVVESFDPAQEEWCEYAERLTHYFVANDIAADEKKRAILLGDRKFR